MRTFRLFFSTVLLGLVAAIPAFHQTRPSPTPRSLSAREIADRVLPSVVLILTLDETGRPVGQGSGFFIRPGLVASNLHVFDRASSANVKDVRSGKVTKALEVVGIDAINDLCVIRVDDTSVPALASGNSLDVGTGDEVYVASNPKGLEGSFTKGIVSSVRRDLDLIQIDAAISPGSSGGVLVNSKAQAIGVIKSSIIGGQNLNFAIPINKLLAVSVEFKESIQLAGSIAYNAWKRSRLKGPVYKLTEKALPMDSKGNRKSGEPMTNFEAEFSRSGQSISQSYYDLSTGVLVYKVEKTYASNGLLTRQLTTWRGGRVEDLKLNADQGIDFAIRTRQYSGVFTTEGRSRTFDSDGRNTSTSESGRRTESVFNSDGLEAQDTFYESEKIEKIRRYSYKYDAYGNWIEKTVSIIFPNSPPLDKEFFIWSGETEYREITYFK